MSVFNRRFRRGSNLDAIALDAKVRNVDGLTPAQQQALIDAGLQIGTVVGNTVGQIINPSTGQPVPVAPAPASSKGINPLVLVGGALLLFFVAKKL